MFQVWNVSLYVLDCSVVSDTLGPHVGCSPSMEFSRQEYWSGLPFPTPGGLPNIGIKPTSLESPALAGGFLIASTTWEAPVLL